MNQFFGYIRVSTAKQGEQGVSLQQQRDAIERYAQRNSLEVVRWFEEQDTAAKRGRPIFGVMMRLLRKRQTAGVIIHKIDRSARNLKDWADLGELIDTGIDVRFANEALDLTSRGGRLSADIQAVVAADYIRNLREETKKGFFGRLKQVLFPMPAPAGYLNVGAGKPKAIDPITGPLIRRAFELYATAKFSYHSLADELTRSGLRVGNGSPLTVKRLSKILNNTFYMGLITIGKTGEVFAGTHPPLVSRDLFEQVQDVMHGRTNTRPTKHDFLYRRRITCKGCGYSLIGETHKGYVYYRCQASGCHKSIVREEVIETATLKKIEPLQFSPEERAYLKQELAKDTTQASQPRQQYENSLRLRDNQINERLNRVTDAFIDRLIDRAEYERRKKALLLERISIQNGLQARQANQTEDLADLLERANAAYLTYKTGSPEAKRELFDLLTSNSKVDEKLPEITLAFPFDRIAKRSKCMDGSPTRNIARTWKPLLKILLTALSTTPARRIAADAA